MNSFHVVPFIVVLLIAMVFLSSLCSLLFELSWWRPYSKWASTWYSLSLILFHSDDLSLSFTVLFSFTIKLTFYYIFQ